MISRRTLPTLSIFLSTSVVAAQQQTTPTPPPARYTESTEVVVTNIDALLPRDGERTARFNVHLRIADTRGGLSKTADAAREVRIPLADVETLPGKWYTFKVDLLSENKPIRVAAGITDVHAGSTSVAVGEVHLQKH